MLNLKKKLINLFMKNLFSPVAIFIFILTGCAKPDTAMVTLITGLENRNPVKNLMQSLVTPHQRNLALRADGLCAQKNLFVGVKTGESDDDSDINTFPLGMITPYDITPPEIDSGWLADNATFPPIRIPVTRGRNIKFGMIGSVIASTGAEDDGSCAPYGSSVLSINPTYSVAGHAEAYVNGDVQIPINVWTINATSTPTPDSAYGVDCSSTNGNDSTSQYCANQNFYRVSCDGCVGPVKFEYFFGQNRAEHTTQMIAQSDLNSGSVSIPNIGTIIMTLRDSLNESDVGTATVLSTSFLNGKTTVNVNMSGAASGIASLSFYEGATVASTPTPVPSPTPFALIAANDLNGLTTLTWDPIENLSNFTIQYSTSSGGSYADVPGSPFNADEIGQQGLTFESPGTTDTQYYFRVSANDTNGNTIPSSNELTVTSLGPFISLTFSSLILTWPTYSGTSATSITVNGDSGTGGAFTDVSTIGTCNTVSIASTTCTTSSNATYQVKVGNGDNGLTIRRAGGSKFIPIGAVKSTDYTRIKAWLGQAGEANTHYYLEKKAPGDSNWSSALGSSGIPFTPGDSTFIASINILNSDNTSSGTYKYRVVVQPSSTYTASTETSASNIIEFNYP